MLFASNDLIAASVAAYRKDGVAWFTPSKAAAPTVPLWLMKVQGWLANQTPEDFGYYRRR